MGRGRLGAGLFLVLLPALLLVGLLGCSSAREADGEFVRVWDRPLLATRHQVWEAQATGRCAFHFGGEGYVVEGLPRGYVEYSREYSRMM